MRLAVAAAIGAPVLIAGAAVALFVFHPHTSPQPPRPLSSSLLAVLESQGITVQAARESVPVSESQAERTALGTNQPGSIVLADELAIVRFHIGSPSATLCWVVSIDPFGGVVSGLQLGRPPIPGNYRVDFVDARSGLWLQATAGYAPTLPSFPPLADATG